MKLIQSVVVDFYESPATFGMGLAGGLLLGATGTWMVCTILEENEESEKRKEEYKTADAAWKKRMNLTPAKAKRGRR